MTALFHPGSICATPGVIEATTHTQRLNMLARHLDGDWGICCAEDKATNDEAVKIGNRILSAYPIDKTKPAKGYGENVVWIITEADRSVTTFLLPSEY